MTQRAWRGSFENLIFVFRSGTQSRCTQFHNLFVVFSIKQCVHLFSLFHFDKVDYSFVCLFHFILNCSCWFCMFMVGSWRLQQHTGFLLVIIKDRVYSRIAGRSSLRFRSLSCNLLFPSVCRHVGLHHRRLSPHWLLASPTAPHGTWQLGPGFTYLKPCVF